MELDVTCLKCADNFSFTLTIRKEKYMYERKILGAEGKAQRFGVSVQDLSDAEVVVTYGDTKITQQL